MLSEIIIGIGRRLSTYQVISNRYIWELTPFLEKDEWEDDCRYMFEGNDPIHVVPKKLKDKMSPVTRTAYATVVEAIGTPVVNFYELGRCLRKAEHSSLDERVNDLFFATHASHAATEIYFFKNPASSILDKAVGYSVGFALAPVAFLGGLVSPKSVPEECSQ